jgi:hypothetical protein
VHVHEIHGRGAASGEGSRIEFLITGSSTDQRHIIEAFGQGLRDLGWFEGR